MQACDLFIQYKSFSLALNRFSMKNLQIVLLRSSNAFQIERKLFEQRHNFQIAFYLFEMSRLVP